MAPARCDIAVVGGGILGLAAARELKRRDPDRAVTVLEREQRVGTHQTSHNSGVVHAGIYYKPGSLKARLCVAGARELYEYCDKHGVPYRRSGKVIVARDERELARLDDLEARARSNEVEGIRRLTGAELREAEPHCVGLAALHSPATGVVDFSAVAAAMAAELEGMGVPVTTGCGVSGTRASGRELVLEHSGGDTVARFAVFCAGSAADELAVQAGGDPDPRIVPFVGRYLHLRPGRAELVRSLIYPVPDPALPFLGVHLSRHIDDRVSLGPTALLLPRARSLAWPGTWRMARRWWRTGLTEIRHRMSRGALAREARGYVPEISADDLEDGFSGVRAQALARDGTLVDDFVVSRTDRALHVRNAPSPAATSALALARLIADEAEAGLS